MEHWKGTFWGAVIGLFFLGLPGLLIGGLIGHFWIDRSKGRPISAKVWGGLLGMMFAGPLGAIAGVYLGKSMEDLKRHPRQMDNRALFHVHLLSILSYVIRSDHDVDRREIETVLGVFRKMGCPVDQMAVLQRTLEFALTQPIDLPRTCVHFRRISSYQERLMLLRVVYLVVMADGKVHPNEQQAAQEIAHLLGIQDEDLQSLQAEFIPTHDRYYELLGLKPGATKTEIKKAYRKLALSHHPDRVAHLGEEYVRMAKEKFQKINEAYEIVLKEAVE